MANRLARYIPLVQVFAARVVLFHAVIAERLDLNATEFKCFRLAEIAGGITATQLALEAGLTMPAVTVVVDRLEASGFVERVRDRTDRRKVAILAKPAAVKRVNALYTDYSAAVADLLKSYDEREFEFLLRYLNDTSELLQKELRAATEGDRSPKKRRARLTARGA